MKQPQTEATQKMQGKPGRSNEEKRKVRGKTKRKQEETKMVRDKQLTPRKKGEKRSGKGQKKPGE